MNVTLKDKLIEHFSDLNLFWDYQTYRHFCKKILTEDEVRYLGRLARIQFGKGFLTDDELLFLPRQEIEKRLYRKCQQKNIRFVDLLIHQYKILRIAT